MSVVQLTLVAYDAGELVLEERGRGGVAERGRSKSAFNLQVEIPGAHGEEEPEGEMTEVV